MDEDIDIYADLPNVNIDDNENHYKISEDLKQKCCALEQQLKELTNRIDKIQKDKKQIEVNMSSLLLCAKAEINRKDKLIADLRKQLDNAAFRRGIYKHPLKQEKMHLPNSFNNFSNIKKETLSQPDITEYVCNAEGIYNNYYDNIASVNDREEGELLENEDDEITDQKYALNKASQTLYGMRLKKKLMEEDARSNAQKVIQEKESNDDSEQICESNKISSTLHGETLKKKVIQEDVVGNTQKCVQGKLLEENQIKEDELQKQSESISEICIDNKENLSNPKQMENAISYTKTDTVASVTSTNVPEEEYIARLKPLSISNPLRKSRYKDNVNSKRTKIDEDQRITSDRCDQHSHKYDDYKRNESINDSNLKPKRERNYYNTRDYDKHKNRNNHYDDTKFVQHQQFNENKDCRKLKDNWKRKNEYREDYKSYFQTREYEYEKSNRSRSKSNERRYKDKRHDRRRSEKYKYQKNNYNDRKLPDNSQNKYKKKEDEENEYRRKRRKDRKRKSTDIESSDELSYHKKKKCRTPEISLKQKEKLSFKNINGYYEQNNRFGFENWSSDEINYEMELDKNDECHDRKLEPWQDSNKTSYISNEKGINFKENNHCFPETITNIKETFETEQNEEKNQLSEIKSVSELPTKKTNLQETTVMKAEKQILMAENVVNVVDNLQVVKKTNSFETITSIDHSILVSQSEKMTTNTAQQDDKEKISSETNLMKISQIKTFEERTNNNIQQIYKGNVSMVSVINAEEQGISITKQEETVNPVQDIIDGKNLLNSTGTNIEHQTIPETNSKTFSQNVQLFDTQKEFEKMKGTEEEKFLQVEKHLLETDDTRTVEYSAAANSYPSCSLIIPEKSYYNSNEQLKNDLESKSDNEDKDSVIEKDTNLIIIEEEPAELLIKDITNELEDRTDENNVEDRIDGDKVITNKTQKESTTNDCPEIGRTNLFEKDELIVKSHINDVPETVDESKAEKSDRNLKKYDQEKMNIENDTKTDFKSKEKIILPNETEVNEECNVNIVNGVNDAEKEIIEKDQKSTSKIEVEDTKKAKSRSKCKEPNMLKKYVKQKETVTIKTKNKEPSKTNKKNQIIVVARRRKPVKLSNCSASMTVVFNSEDVKVTRV